MKSHMGDFIELPLKTSINSGDRFCEMELQHTKRSIIALQRYIQQVFSVYLKFTLSSTYNVLRQLPLSGITPSCFPI
jgi:hypothetical protein